MVNLPSGPDYEPTHDVPLVTDTMKSFLATIDRGILSDLSEAVIDAAKDRSRLAHEGVVAEKASTARLVEDEDSQHTMMMLVHSMPKHLIRAVVLGVTAVMRSVPFDVPGHLAKHIYIVDGPGAYVVSIAVEGREGKWLTGKELRGLIKLLDKYRDAAQLRANQHSQHTAEERKLLAFARDVDRFYVNSSQIDGASYISNGKSSEKLASFTHGLKSLLRGAAEDVALCQAPNYVGCSTTSIKIRTASHTPKANWYINKGNYVWWLTMSCMRMMNLEPEVFAVPAIRTWEYGQLPIAEILLTQLAGSLVEDRGYNIAQPGSTPDSGNHDFTRDVEAAERYLPYLTHNINETLGVTRERTERLRRINSYNPFEEQARRLQVLHDAELAAREIDQSLQACLAQLGDFTALNSAVDRQKRACEQISGMQATINGLIEALEDSSPSGTPQDAPEAGPSAAGT